MEPCVSLFSRSTVTQRAFNFVDLKVHSCGWLQGVMRVDDVKMLGLWVDVSHTVTHVSLSPVPAGTAAEEHMPTVEQLSMC